MNPFDDPQGEFVVLVNAKGQHSLWPQAIPVPAGWACTYGPAAQDECLQHVELEWPDIRPAGVRATTGSGGDAR